MKIENISATLLAMTPEPLALIERAGRTCYKSEKAITPESSQAFVKMLIERGHEAVLEHASASILFVCDRGVSHELVRHRLAAYCQESTRYVSSVDDGQFIIKNEEDVVERYLGGMSMSRISKLSKGAFTEWQIYEILEEHDIARRPKGNSGLTRHNFFHSIDSVEKAYLLGLIQADGNIRSGDKPQIAITQHRNYSWYIARMIKDYIRQSVCRSVDKNCHQMAFTSDQIREDLVSKGIVPRKSYDMTERDANLLWAAVPDKLKPSFLRGFLDGDGSVRFFKQANKGETDSCNISWLGNRSLLCYISAWLYDKFSYKAGVNKVTDAADLWRVGITQPEVGEAAVRVMLEGFRYPYGHPAKTARMIDRVGGSYPIVPWGDEKFCVIQPPGLNGASIWMWLEAVDASEDAYRDLREQGIAPQIARAVLPQCLKVEIVCTMNFREWRYVLALRTDPEAHPQMREMMACAAVKLQDACPVVFDDIQEVCTLPRWRKKLKEAKP